MTKLLPIKSAALAIGMLSFGHTFAQRQLLLGAQYDYGIHGKEFQANRDILRTKGIGTVHTFSINGQYHIGNRFGIEGGISQSSVIWNVKDKDFERRSEGFVVDIKSRNNYLGYYGALKYIQPLDGLGGHALYFQVGYHNNSTGSDSLYKSTKYLLTNEEFEVSTNYVEKFGSVMPRIGMNIHTLRGTMWNFSVGYNMALGDVPMMRGNYSITTAGGDIVSQDKFNLSGNNLSFNLGFNVYLMDLPAKEKAVKPTKPEKPVKETPVKPDNTKPDETKPSTGQTVGNRDYTVTNKMKVESKEVTISIWDNQVEDGDRVSISMNGQWILENHLITKRKHTFKATLKEGDNDFVLYALNLGKYPPNTAAISVFDGKKEHIVIIKSDMKNSGAIRIKY